jgi:hypothetical protein
VIRPTSTLVSILPLLALTSATAVAAPVVSSPTHRIDPDTPWALAIDDPLSKSLVEQWYGPEVAEAWRDIEPQWRGTTLLTRDSFDEEMLATLGVPPVPAMNYEPSPGVVFVAMDGVTLQPTCGNGDSANSALNCSPLVNAETTFPAFGGAAASEFQTLQSYYEPFDIVMTSNRPPEWLPYTLTVIGGTAAQAGLPLGVCGVANVACDGLKRNHVSLNFGDSCNGMAEVAAQETAHNWGLEHVDDPTDLLYPFTGGGSQSFVDECSPINHDTGGPITQCGYIHEVYCEAGAGEEQNSHAELLGVFGPRTPDTTAPEIVSVTPADGSVIASGEDLIVTAEITDDSLMVGVKWTWVEGLPEKTESYTRCTNATCDQDFNPGVSFVASEMPWDFVVLSGAPDGTYTFKVEVLDAYGNYDSETVTFEIGDGSGESADSGLDESGGSGAVDTGGDELPGDTGGGSSDGGDATGDSGSALDGGSSSGGCRIASPGWSWMGLLGLLAFGARRRRE